MKKIIVSFLAIFLSALSESSAYGAETDTISADPSSGAVREKAIVDTLNTKQKITQLIVGCGKSPYEWNPQDEHVINAWSNDEDQGDHTHSNCLTLAEVEAVQPDILWDWTQPVPECMHNRFTFIYLERLPPRVLEQEICWKNVYACLQPGKQFIFDYQIYNIPGKTYSIINPFCIAVPPIPAKKQKEIEDLQLSIGQDKKEFLQISGTSKDTVTTPDAFIERLKSNPRLWELNLSVGRKEGQIKQIQEKIMRLQCDTIQKFKGAMYEGVKALLASHGFSSVKLAQNRKNPYNKRSSSTLMWGTK